MIGVSTKMRRLFEALERVAASRATVMLVGETGSGKGVAAESIHHASDRKQGPFVVVDCGSIPANLLESELFGHEKGAFTGAHAMRIGAFEEANGGTLFLDEIGELPSELQPKLLRGLESRTVRRIGSNVHRPVDVRVIAATNRDLRVEVNAGRFRPDLFFRLAVVKLTVPPLREHPEDISAIAEKLLESLGVPSAQVQCILSPSLLERLQCAAWPGNIRELRNFLERYLIFADDSVLSENCDHAGVEPEIESLSYADARQKVIFEFEREYVKKVLDLHAWNVSQAARASGLSRVFLYRLMSRHRLVGAGKSK